LLTTFAAILLSNMKRKKILWLCSWYPGKTDPFNGDFIQRHAHAAAMYNDIHVIHAIQTNSDKITGTTTETSHSPGLTEQVIYVKRKNSVWGKIQGYYRWRAALRQAIQEYVHQNGKPYLVHVNVPMKAGLFALWMKRKYGIEYVVTEHWGIYNDVEVLNYIRRSGAFKYYTKQIFSKAAGFISVSQYLAEGVCRLVVKKKYEVVPNVVDTSLFFYKEKTSANFRFIHVSNMVPLKNVQGILEAFRVFREKNEDAELVMVGDTDPAIAAFANNIGLPDAAVSFRGEIPYNKVACEMQAANCFVLFSDIENSPCVIGEALCCGLPVIATRVGGVPELIDDSDAILVNPRDTNALGNAMQKMIAAADVYDRKKIAENAAGKFSYSVIGKKLDEIYSKINGSV
jgi:glycosyltransferase involved in cell wall biosynthesis